MISTVIPTRELAHLVGFYEPFSAISHLLGAVAFTVLGVMLLKRGRGCRARATFLGVYAFSAVLLMSMSGLYHMMEFGGAAHAVLRRLDHCAIFILIAGTFTPIHGLLFRGVLRWGVLVLIWACAAAGIVTKMVLFASVPEWVGLTMYMAMGWLGVVTGVVLYRRYSLQFVSPLIWAGIAYTFGGIVDFLRVPTIIPGVIESHDVFHVFVIAGALLHWVFIYRIADGRYSPVNVLEPRTK
jgi:channel protein (hemolysin III family)